MPSFVSSNNSFLPLEVINSESVESIFYESFGTLELNREKIGEDAANGLPVVEATWVPEPVNAVPRKFAMINGVMKVNPEYKVAVNSGDCPPQQPTRKESLNPRPTKFAKINGVMKVNPKYKEAMNSTGGDHLPRPPERKKSLELGQKSGSPHKKCDLSPKKFATINGVMKVNPEYKEMLLLGDIFPLLKNKCSPKKFATINGVMRLNPEYKAFGESTSSSVPIFIDPESSKSEVTHNKFSTINGVKKLNPEYQIPQAINVPVDTGLPSWHNHCPFERGVSVEHEQALLFVESELSPKKYAKIDGIMKLNPEYEALRGAAETNNVVMEPQEAVVLCQKPFSTIPLRRNKSIDTFDSIETIEWEDPIQREFPPRRDSLENFVEMALALTNDAFGECATKQEMPSFSDDQVEVNLESSPYNLDDLADILPEPSQNFDEPEGGGTDGPTEGPTDGDEDTKNGVKEDVELFSLRIPDTDIRPKDVLMGRSPYWRKHPGNMQLKELVDDKYDDYFDVKTSRKQQTKIATTIVKTIIRVGGRFLRRPNRKKRKQELDGDADSEISWVELSEIEARYNVASKFRNILKKGTRELKKEST